MRTSVRPLIVVLLLTLLVTGCGLLGWQSPGRQAETPAHRAAWRVCAEAHRGDNAARVFLPFGFLATDAVMQDCIGEKEGRR